MYTYTVTFNGYGANRVIYRDQQVTFQCRHNWSLNTDEAANVMYVAHEEVKKHFSRYKIIGIEAR